ncbi:hypothetical protein Dimus_001545, partial [Dionaea muscipula]
MREIKKEQLRQIQQIHENNMREKKFMRPGNVGNIAKQLQQKKRVQMFVLQPSQQPLAHEGQETIKKKKLFVEEVIQECQRQDNEKQVVEKEKEQENQTPNAMQTADVDDQVLGSSAMHSDAGELRTDGHERDGGKKRKRMSKADQVLGSSAMHNDAGELRTDGHERGGDMPRGRGGTRGGGGRGFMDGRPTSYAIDGEDMDRRPTPYAIDEEDMDRRPTPYAIDEETDVSAAAHDPSNIDQLPNPSVTESSSDPRSAPNSGLLKLLFDHGANLTLIFKSKYESCMPKWKDVPLNIRDLWFNEFMKVYRWDPSIELAVQRAFEKKAATRFLDIL